MQSEIAYCLNLMRKELHKHYKNMFCLVMNVLIMNSWTYITSHVVIVLRLIAFNSSPWPNGTVKCTSDAHLQIGGNSRSSMCFVAIWIPWIWTYYPLQHTIFHLLYGKDVCIFGCSASYLLTLTMVLVWLVFFFFCIKAHSHQRR